MVAGEEDRLEWINELLCGGEGGDSARTVPLIGQRRDDSDEDTDPQLLDIVDVRTCVALFVYLGLLVVVLLVACVLIVWRRFYVGDVVLCCVIALYELSVLLIVVLAVVRRRSTMVAQAPQSRGEGGGTASQPDGRVSPSSAALPLASP